MSEPLRLDATLDTIPFAVLVDEAWRATRTHWRALLGPAALALLPGALGLQVVMAMVNLTLVEITPGASELGAFLGTIALGVALGLLFLVWIGVVFGSLEVAVVHACTGQQPRFGPAARFYLRPRVWGTDLLARICMVLGMVACVVPGLLVACAWAGRLPIMVLEGRTGLDALRRSWQTLMHNRGRDWTRHPLVKVVLLFVLGAVLGYAVSLVIQAPALIVNQLIVMRGMARGSGVDAQAVVRATLWLSIPTGVLAALAQLGVQLYMDFAITFLVLDQLRRKEGLDLRAALDEIERREPRPPEPPPPEPLSPLGIPPFGGGAGAA